MTLTSTPVISSHILSEIMGNALAPMFRKYTALPFMNRSNIDGDPSLKRKIPVRNAIAAAYPDLEGHAPGSAASMSYASAIELTPVGYVQLIELTMRAIRRRMPGATRESVISAIESGDPSALPVIADAVQLSLDAHLRAAEVEALNLAAGLSRTSGTTNQVLSVATFLDAQTKLLNGDTSSAVQGKPEHEEMVAVIDEIGVQHIRAELSSSTTGLASLWANPQSDVSLFSLSPDVSRNGLRGALAGTAIYAADGALMPFANGTTDRVGMMILRGQGATGDPGSLRGFAEFCEGHAPSIEFERSKLSDVLSVPSRWEWVVGEHTDLHGVRLLYRAT
jgi:hypothetical protein